MNDPIDRAAALDAIGEEPPVWHEDDSGEMAERNQWRRDVAAIRALPSAQKRGEWEEMEVKPVRSTGIYEVQSAKCSICGRYHTKPYLYFFDFDNYCPYCGARMTKDE